MTELSSSDWQHPVRKRMQAGEPVFALTVTTSSVEIAALGATLGFDFLWVEMEHSPVTLETLRHMVLAARGLPAAVFARVPVIELWTAKRVLDQGVSGVIFPFTSTADLARRAAQACRYPPLGLRGSGAGLATATWADTGSYYDSADRHVFTICVIEDGSAIDNIDEIAAVPGVDVLFIGTSDLSFSLGFRGAQDSPVLHEAIGKVVAAAKRNGKFLGRPAGTAEQVREFQAQGFQMFQCTTEINFFAAAARQFLEPLGKAGVPPEKRAFY